MRVIPFSRTYPAKHPRKGERTLFPAKIIESLLALGTYEVLDEHLELAFMDGDFTKYDVPPKWHTIRANRKDGKLWKVGDFFKPVVWSGKPYYSKQIQFAPPIEIKKVWDIQIEFIGKRIDVQLPTDKPGQFLLLSAGDVAKNDGLDVHDFIDWFAIHPKKKEVFKGQIICWNESINY